MKGYVIPENAHLVPILHPVDINAGVSTDVFSMRNYGHVDILVMIGVSNAATTITVEECDNFTPTTHTEIAFNVYKCETALSDVLGARTAVTSAGFATSANDTIFYVISLDAAELADGYPNVRLSFSNPGGATYASAIAVLSGGIAKPQSPTEIA